MKIEISPKFNFNLSSTLYLKNWNKIGLNHLKLDLSLDYDIQTKLFIQIKSKIDNYLIKNILSKDSFQFQTEFQVSDVMKIPGKITILDFGIESLEIRSRSSISGSTDSCSLKGKIDTSLIFSQGKKIYNGVQRIIKKQSFCKMKLSWSRYSDITISFQFTVNFELDKRNEITFKKLIDKSTDKKSLLSANEWLLSRKT